METEESASPSKWFLVALVVVMLAIVGGVAASLAIPLQPPLHPPSTGPPPGTVIMPAGVGDNLKLSFEPRVITVVIGENNTVTFKNEDTVTHSVTSVTTPGGTFDEILSPGQSWTYTFTTPGDYSYHCIFHSWMTAMVIVLPASSS